MKKVEEKKKRLPSAGIKGKYNTNLRVNKDVYWDNLDRKFGSDKRPIDYVKYVE